MKYIIALISCLFLSTGVYAKCNDNGHGSDCDKAPKTNNGGNGGAGGNGGQGGNGGHGGTGIGIGVGIAGASAGASASNHSHNTNVNSNSNRQGQLQGQLQGQQQGQIATGGSVSGSGNSTNTNNNTANGGAGGSASAGAVSGSSSSATNAGNNQNVTFTSPSDVTVRSVGVAPDMITAPTAPCRIAVSASGGWIGGAFGFGTSVLDESCRRIEVSRHLNNLGLKDAATKVMCNEPEAAAALGEKVCPQPPKQEPVEPIKP